MSQDAIIKVFEYNHHLFEGMSADELWNSFHLCYPDVSYSEYHYAAMTHYGRLYLKAITYLNQLIEQHKRLNETNN